jgi:hypothetical protein
VTAKGSRNFEKFAKLNSMLSFTFLYSSRPMIVLTLAPWLALKYHCSYLEEEEEDEERVEEEVEVKAK